MPSLTFDLGDRVDRYYCSGCQNLVPHSETTSCNVCFNLWCQSCLPAHNHNGEYCDDCGYATSDSESVTQCDNCGVTVCRYHLRDNHQRCEYVGDDDGRYTGRPPVQRFGAEASMEYIDAPYMYDPRAQGKRAAAVEIEVEYMGRGRRGNEVLSLPESVGITHDGSLSNGIEVTTPPARGKVLADIVTDTCRLLREGEYGIRETCGLHTHIDLRDKRDDKKFLSHLFNAFISIEDILYAMQVSGREFTSYSVPLRNSYKFFDMYGQMSGDFDYTFYKAPKSWEGMREMNGEKSRKYAHVRYAAFNFHSVYYRGSLECRIHEGTVDERRILQWVDLLQTIIARVESGPHSYKVMKRLAGMDVTMSKVRLFAKYFGLSDEQVTFVANQIEEGRGFGWHFSNPIVWGTPRRGRPRKDVRPPAMRLQFVGREVVCNHCHFRWTLRTGTTWCPNCREAIMDRYYGDRYYTLASTWDRRERELERARNRIFSTYNSIADFTFRGSSSSTTPDF